MLLTHDISDFARVDLSEARVAGMSLQEAVTEVLAQENQGALPCLSLVRSREDLLPVRAAYERLKGFAHVVILGTGGSSLGARSLTELTKPLFGAPSVDPTLHFVENVDPHTLLVLFQHLPASKTAFVAVSKSGSTAETMAQFLCALDWVRTHLGEKALKNHFQIITEPKSSPLRDMAQKYDMPILDHAMDIGGRYSVFSCVGLLPALLAGVDIEAVRQGALQVLQDFQTQGSDSAPALGAACCVALEAAGRSINVVMPYCDRLNLLALWHRQLWAESLGKQGKGSLPAPALGTVDQHSQLQLFLEGPKDKFFTIIYGQTQGEGPTFAPDLLADDARLAYLSGRCMGDLLKAEQSATCRTLINHGCPVRLISYNALSAPVMGSLMMHFMLETMVAAKLMGVNAFDQEAVEESKILTRTYLRE